MKHQNINVIENGIKITLNLGRQGEYNVRDVIFDMSDFQQKYGDGTATIVHYPTNGSAYTVPSISGDSKDSAVLDSENILTWTIGRLATMHDGYGIAEITWLTADGLKKSIRYNTYCKESIGNYGTDRAAQQSYIDQMVELASTITDLSSEFSDAERIAAEISDARENAVSDIETLESNVIGSINNAKSESIEDIRDSKESALDALNTAKQTALSDVESAKQDAETDINAAILIAETHANNASQSATNASNSATSASNSADSASQSATQASESASNANQSAESASQFADNASNSANSASQSAEDAQTSANNASTSEQNARQSAETAQDVLESVQAEGNTQIGRVQAKGDEVIESLPDDFTQVQNDIAALNGSLDDNLNSMVIADQYDPFTSWEGGAYKYSEAGYPLENSTVSALNKTRKRSLKATISGRLILTAKEGYSFRVFLCDRSSIIVSVTDFIKSFDKYCGYKTTLVVKSDSDANISATDIGDIITAQYYPSKAEKIYQYDIPFDRGSILSNNGALSNSDIVNLPVYRRSAYPYKVKPGSRIEISLPETFDSSRVFYYDETGAFLSYVQLTVAPTVRLLVPNNAHYFMFSGASSADIDYVLTLKSEYPIRKVGNFNLNLNATTYKSIAFPYKVSGDVYTSGRLMLPPNYTPDGENVPLIVFCHGSNGMKTWTSDMFTVGSHSYKSYYDYLNNEGFAVFDCYPWTTKYDSIGSGVNTTYALAHCKRAYIEGVKYVCDRFNIDADRVCMIAKSQGGHIGHWASVQADFPFKAIALYAPSVTLFNPITKQMLFNASVRTAISQIIDFDGTEEQKTAFKENGLYTNETVLSFIALNENKFAGLTPALHGVHGDTYEIMFEYSKNTVNALPEWMNGLPALTYEHSELINHPEYSKHALCPVKFWCAFDDENTSSYVNYAVYQWMKNGGSDVQYRILPDGTGGHYAMDADTHALKSSGTTALGIEYTNMPTAYVETVTFFREKLAM